MAVADHVGLERFMEGVRKRNPGQPEFHQAVQEVAGDVFAFIADKEAYHRYQILRRIAEPDRVVSFRVCWEDDARQHPRAARLARAEQQRHRALQGRHPLPPQRHRERAQVPGLRADLQEQPHRVADGRRQGRGQLQPARQVRPRGHALLPVLHDRALPPCRARHRRAGRGHRRRGARDRLHVRPVQAHHQPLQRRPHRQGAGVRRQPDPHRGDGLRRGLLPREHARACRRFGRRQGVPGVRLGQRGDACRREDQPARRQGRDPFRFRRLRPRPRRHRRRQAGLGQGPQGRAPRPHRRICRGVQGRRLSPGRTALERSLRPRAAMRDPERARRRRRPDP